MNKMGLSAEMNTKSMVSLIEKLLPPTQKRDWVLTAQRIKDSSKLIHGLLEFWLRGKRFLGYTSMESELRPTDTSKAIVHNVVNDSENVELGMINVIQKMQENQQTHQIHAGVLD